MFIATKQVKILQNQLSRIYRGHYFYHITDTRGTGNIKNSQVQGKLCEARTKESDTYRIICQIKDLHTYHKKVSKTESIPFILK